MNIESKRWRVVADGPSEMHTATIFDKVNKVHRSLPRHMLPTEAMLAHYHEARFDRCIADAFNQAPQG